MRKLSTFLFVLSISLAFFTQSFSQNFSILQNQKSGLSPNSPESLVTINYDGANAGTSIGDGGTTFIGGARFTSTITGPLTGGELQFVQFYYSQAATGLTIKIYDAGTATDPGALLVDQPLDLGLLTVGDWNEVELSTYVPISGNDLWICLEVADATAAAFPFGVDAGPADPNGDFLNDAGTWDHLADFGLSYNWNIRGVVEDSPVIGPEPEMSLTHTPGDLHVGIYNTGAIGTEQLGATGPGITWKGEQGLYMGGVIFGTAASASVNGVFGSFTSGGSPVLNDLKNVSSNFTAGFTSNANFDQIAQAVLYDSAAPVPYDVEIIQKSYSNTGDDFVFIRYGFINRSSAEIIDGYSGIALDWDIGNYTTNSGGYGLYNTFVYQFDAGPTSSYYFGIVALDGAGGMRTSAASAFGPPFNDVRLNIFDWISTFDPTIPANGDFRSYIGSGPGTGTPVGDTSWVTFAIVAGDNLDQITNNAVDASVKAFNLGWTSIVVPVELSAFSANVDNRNVNLNWSTATELNNSGFQIERSSGGEYQVVGFVAGHGTTTDIQNYSYSDQNVNAGTYSYRLKQVDYDGTFEYSNAVEVEVVGVIEFTLGQNYPNPFNPTTTINFSLAEPSFVKLAVYNLLGEEVKVLKNEYMSAGSFNVSFDASSLPSGMYLYKVETAQFSSVRKMMLMK